MKTCYLCDQPMIIGPHELESSPGVARHVTSDGEIDYDQDADHVPHTAPARADVQQALERLRELKRHRVWHEEYGRYRHDDVALLINLFSE